MPTRRSTNYFDRVRRIGLALPDVEEGTSYGVPALKVKGKMFACVPTNRAVEPESLVVRMPFLERDLRLTYTPAVYYLKPHYEGYPCVLARVTLMKDGDLKELLETGLQYVRTAKAK